MLSGSCHCGAVTWELDTNPASATACNCTICRRYGALWAYGHEDHDIRVRGDTTGYARSDSGDILFHFCAACGGVTHYVARDADAQGRRRAAVNLRMSALAEVGEFPVRRFDGCSSFRALPPDGRRVRDLWF